MGKPNAKKKLEIVGGEDEHNKFGKSFTPHNLVSFSPKTKPQEKFWNAYFQKETPIIVQTGSAGTGKTALSLYAALCEVLSKETVYDKIVLIRSSVQAREIGFLKGDENEKNEVYESPYVALCDELLEFKSNNYNNLKAKNLIEFHNTSFLRGKTFDNAIIIFDEHENATYHELSTALTRLGVNSRIIFNGDQKQTDLHRKNDVSGLGRFMNVIRSMPDHLINIVEYTPHDIVRGEICKAFLIAEENQES